MSAKEIDIAIIGGGLLGMMSAYYLAESGQNIGVFDKSTFAGESSWAGGGILTPLYPWLYAGAINELAFRSQKLYPALVDDLKLNSGIDPEYFNSGMLVSSIDVDQQALHWLNANNVTFNQAKPSNCTNLTVDDYVLLPKICQVRNPRFARSLKLTLQKKRHVTLTENCAVDHITPVSDHSFIINTSAGEVHASKVIVSAGAWSGEILERLGITIPIKPVRGQMLLFKGEPGLLPAIILAEGKYIIPRIDGHVLVGSTMEDVGFDKSTTEQAYKNLMEFVKARCPALAQCPVVKHWSGLRPGSPQGIPYIFEHPIHKGLFVNTGHFRNGVVLAPASAELIRDLVLDQKPVIDPRHYNHTRSPVETEFNIQQENLTTSTL